MEILSLHEPTCAKRRRREQPTKENSLPVKDDTFQSSQPSSIPGFSRQESLLQTLEILENLEFAQAKDEKDESGSFQDETTDSSEDGYAKFLSPKNEDRTESLSLKTCSYPSTTQTNYFVVNKPKSLSYQHSFNIDSRCIAL